MKHLLSRIVAVATVAVLTHASSASAVIQKCGFGDKTITPGTTTNITCPLSLTQLDIRSFTKVQGLGTLWIYSTGIVVGPASPSLQPRVAAQLVTSSGQIVVSSAGTACPQAVDATVDAFMGFEQRCTTSTSTPPRKVSIFHTHL